MTPLEASHRIVEWVIWNMRVQDIPPDIRDACETVRDGYPRPEALQGRPVRHAEGPLIVSGFPRDEEKLIDRRGVWPHQVADVVRELVETGEMGYVLVCDN